MAASNDPNLRGIMVDDLTTGRRPLGSRGGVAEYATDANGNTVLLGADGAQYRPHLGSVLLRYVNTDAYTSGHGVVAVTGAANNGAGLIRLTCDASKMVTGQLVTVADVGGVPNANGTTQAITKIDATHIDLDGSTFAGTYTSGGTVYVEGGIISQTITKAASGASTPYNYIKWGELVHDDTGATSAIYPTNVDRIIVPAGARLARLNASLALNADTGGTYRGMRFYGGAAGTTNIGNVKQFSFHATQTNNIVNSSAWFTVTAGDILRCAVLQDTAADWVNPVGDLASSFFGAEFMA